MARLSLFLIDSSRYVRVLMLTTVKTPPPAVEHHSGGRKRVFLHTGESEKDTMRPRCDVKNGIHVYEEAA